MKKFIFTLLTVLLATLAADAATAINVAGQDCKCDKDYTYTASNITDLKSGTITYTYSTNTLTLTNKSKLTEVYCYDNPQLTTVNIYGNSALTTLTSTDCPALTTLNVTSNTALTRIQCFDNQLTSLNVRGCSALYVLDCQDNKLTSLSVQGCTALRYLNCYLNKITGEGMTTLVNSLPTLSSSDPGTMTVQWYYDEGNEINAAQCATARAKYWNPRRYDGSNYVDIVFESTRGDVDGDGKVGIADVTALIDYLLSGTWGDESSDAHEWVDLGLPSGTLWATTNIGATNPEDYGDYFAWGETEPKDVYDWSTYKWCNGSNTTLTKYCTSSSYGYIGFTDGKTELDAGDDAAYVN